MLTGLTNTVLEPEISAHLADVYGATIGKDTISRITDRVVEEMAESANRPLGRVYPVSTLSTRYGVHAVSFSGHLHADPTAQLA